MKVLETDRVFVLDDDDNRHQWFASKFAGFNLTRAFGFYEAIGILRDNEFDVVFLDHDLGDHRKGDVDIGPYQSREYNGNDVAHWMVHNGRIPRLVVVHSINPEGAHSMVKTLLNAKRVCGKECEVLRMPYNELIKRM